uniref:Uncharacterized protein C6orf118-like n=1 Tax=Phallusia mammillata TaxID=59560 RepID=A0A6F9D8W1_9ASCI|nr:uncharacterized protein C6orf118-like [Phallusia mammillata]
MSKTRRTSTAEKPKNLHALMESTLNAHRRDIHDYASGHLNPNKLAKIPKNTTTLQTGKVVYWTTSNTQDQSSVQSNRRHQRGQMNTMTEALYDFSSGTAGAFPLYNSVVITESQENMTNPSPIDEKLERTIFREMEQLISQKDYPYFTADSSESVFSQPESRKKIQQKRLLSRKKSSKKVHIEELKLPELMLPCTSDSIFMPPSMQNDVLEFGGKMNERKRFVTTHHAGVTRRDQFQKLMDFNRNVLRQPETLEQKVRDGHKAVQHLEHKLVTRLLELQLKNLPFGPSFERLQLYAEIWSDLAVDSSMFGDLLAEIKREYDIYLTQLLDSMKTSDRGELARCLHAVEDLSQEEDLPVVAEELRKDVENLENVCMDVLNRNEKLCEDIEEEEDRIEEEKRLQQEEDEENMRRMLPVRRPHHKTPTKINRTDQDSFKGKRSTEERLKALRVDIWERLDKFSEEKKKMKTSFVPKPVLRNLQHAVKDTEVEWQKTQQQNEFLTVAIQDSDVTLETLFKKMGVDANSAR